MAGDKKSAADVAFKAMQDARAKLKAAGVDYYVVVAWDGYTADDGSIEPVNAPSVIQRLGLVAEKLKAEHEASLLRVAAE
jgi:hypothetical protein